jgi:hypothetical protein
MSVGFFELQHDSPIDQILADVRDLLTEDVEDDNGMLRPTQDAFSWTVLMLTGASITSHADWPLGCVSTDTAGGIRIEWRSHTGEIRLIAHASDATKNYIYHQCGDVHGIDDTDMHPGKLIWWLNSLI